MVPPSVTADVYYPGSEAIAPDEMRIVALGTGMPSPRPKQAAACWLVELGNGDKFLFDLGAGCHERLAAQKIPYDFIDKVFIGHLHVDHMGDLPSFWLGGTTMNRLTPLRSGARAAARPSTAPPTPGPHGEDVRLGHRHALGRHRLPRRRAGGHRVPLRRRQRGHLRRERRGDPEHPGGARPRRRGELHPRVERPQVRLRQRHDSRTSGTSSTPRGPTFAVHECFLPPPLLVDEAGLRAPGGAHGRHPGTHLSGAVRQGDVPGEAAPGRRLSLLQRLRHRARGARAGPEDLRRPALPRHGLHGLERDTKDSIRTRMSAIDEEIWPVPRSRRRIRRTRARPSPSRTSPNREPSRSPRWCSPSSTRSTSSTERTSSRSGRDASR